MDERQEATVILSESECWELLDHATVGRLAVDIAGQPDIFPINFVVDKSGIVFRSAAEIWPSSLARPARTCRS